MPDIETVYREALGLSGAEVREVSVPEAIELYGGGAAGKSALAAELAGTADKKSRAYKSARRNIERYTAAEGRQRRNPKKVSVRISQAVSRHRMNAVAERLRGNIPFRLISPLARVSDDERYRHEISGVLSDAELEPVRDALHSGQESDVYTALDQAIWDAYGVHGGETLEADRLILRE